MDLVSNPGQDNTLKSTGFVVNTLTTANQRAMSKSSTGSSHSVMNSFVHKLASQQKLVSAPGVTSTATPAAVLSNIMK
jgi:hypothetical protein